MTDELQAPNQLDPAKYHILSSKQKRYLIVIVVCFMVLLGPLITYLYYDFAINRPAQDSVETQYVIKEGTAVTDLAVDLHANKLINSEFLFKFYLKVNNLENNVQAGVFKIPAGTSIVELAKIFQTGTSDAAITFLEGWRVEEMALAASEKFRNVDYRDFVEYGRQSEGYLFPDTYYFNTQVDEDEMLRVLKQTFEIKTKDVLTVEAAQKQGLTKEQVVIFASILEREISNPDDMPVVAGILIKRFKDGELIGADATTQYVMANSEACSLALVKEGSPSYCLLDEERAIQVNWWPKDITLAALDKADPYNTRKVVGLPPRPISNPGLRAIKAVLDAEQSNYYFYLTDSQGITRFAETLNEHNQNVQTYL